MIQAKSYLDTSPSIFGYMSALAKEHNAINLTQGAPDFKTPEWLIERFNYYAQKGFNQYSPIPGAIELKKAIAHQVLRNYDVSLDSDDNIMITCGAVEGIFSVLMAYVQKNEEVIYFDPAFDAYPCIVNMIQGVSRRLDLKDNGQIDITAIANAINDKTRVIILNSPHNPMGSVISKEEYQEIAQLVQGKDILVLSDEVYEYIYQGEHFTSALEVEELKDQLVVVQSLGKTYNTTGWRVGTCIAPKTILPHLLAVKQFTSFCAPNPIQLAFADGINQHPEYEKDLPKLYQQQRTKFVNTLKDSHFKVLPWQGSPFQMLDYTHLSDEDDLTFCTRLIKEYGVGLVPISSLYETAKHGLVRVCFAKYDDVLLEGAKKLCSIPTTKAIEIS